MEEPHFDKLSQERDSDSEWEYEYHPTDTETFYVTLDLSSAEPLEAIAKSKRKRKKKTENAAQPENGMEATSVPDAPLSDVPDASPLPDPTTPPGEGNRVDHVRLRDLHTSKPLILYRSQTYACTWADTLGTDIILCAPDLELLHEPLLVGNGFWILSKSVIRLVGQAVDSRKGNNTIIWDDPSLGVGGETEASPANSLSIAEYTQSEAAKQAQVRFLEQFIAAKRARGEQDEALVWQSGRYGVDGSLLEAEEVTGRITISDESSPHCTEQADERDTPDEDQMDIDDDESSISSRSYAEDMEAMMIPPFRFEEPQQNSPVPTELIDLSGHTTNMEAFGINLGALGKNRSGSSRSAARGGGRGSRGRIRGRGRGMDTSPVASPRVKSSTRARVATRARQNRLPSLADTPSRDPTPGATHQDRNGNETQAGSENGSFAENSQMQSSSIS